MDTQPRTGMASVVSEMRPDTVYTCNPTFRDDFRYAEVIFVNLSRAFLLLCKYSHGDGGMASALPPCLRYPGGGGVRYFV